MEYMVIELMIFIPLTDSIVKEQPKILTGVIEIMAKEYLDKLSKLVDEIKISEEIGSQLEVKHFFSGAALYVDGTIRVTWSPVGLAFKLPEPEVRELIINRKAIPLKYFPKGNIKKGYALFANSKLGNPNHWKTYFLKAAQDK